MYDSSAAWIVDKVRWSSLGRKSLSPQDLWLPPFPRNGTKPAGKKHLHAVVQCDSQAPGSTGYLISSDIVTINDVPANTKESTVRTVSSTWPTRCVTARKASASAVSPRLDDILEFERHGRDETSRGSGSDYDYLQGAANDSAECNAERMKHRRRPCQALRE